MMNATPSLLYRFFWLLALCCVPYTLILTADLVMHPFAPEFFFDSVSFRLIAGLILAPVTLAIAFLIMRRKPGNVIGPMLVVWGTSITTWALRSDIGITTTAVLNNISGVGWVVVILMGFFFPTGRLVPERWHTLMSWIVIGTITAPFLLIPTSETLSFLRQVHPNPLYIPLLAPLRDVIMFIYTLSQFLLPFLLPVMVYSVYLRFKQANAIERQQLKWLVLALLTFLLLVPLPLILPNLLGSLEHGIGWLVYVWIYASPAVIIGNAILRHKLYDIDIIIRRTLIYAILTTLLGVIYFGGIILTQQLFRSVTGQSSDLAVVVSTLLIAALFSPLRRRVQDTIDRRLYRRKYNVETTLASFQQNLRDEVDMDTLKANLVGVVNDTMQPTHIALWVRSESDSRL